MRRLLIPLAAALVGLAVPVVGVRGAGAPATKPGSPPAAADPLSQQLQQAMQQQAAIDATKSALAGEVAAAQDQQKALGDLITANRKAITDTMGKIADAERRFTDATTRAATDHATAVEARRHAVQDRALLGSYLTQRYVGQQGLASYLLSSESFPQFMDRTATLSHLASSGNLLVLRVQHDIRVADEAERAAQADADAAQAAATALAQQRDDLEQQTQHEGDLVSKLGGDVAAANTQIAQADGQSVALAQKIADLRIRQLDQTISEADQAAWDEAVYYMQHNITGLPSGQIYDAQHPPPVRFIWPVPGSTFTQMFGPSVYPFEPPAFNFPHFHTGVDMAAPQGTAIYAAGDGVVAAATSSTVGYGNHVIIAHDAHTLTLYGHLLTMLVKPGDVVHQGQLIGLMGSTGNSTGPHTHFEVRVDNQPTDPAPFLPPLPPGATGPPPLPH